MSRLNPIFIAACTLALTGCATLKTSQDAYQNQAYQAENLSEQDRTVLQNQQQLNAASALIQANNLSDAKIYADTIDTSALSPADLSTLHLLQTQISLGLSETPQSLKHLLLIQPALLAATDKATYFRARATVYTLTGKTLESAKARVALQPLLTDARQQLDNKAAILDGLRLLPVQALQTSESDELSGWMALAKLFKLSPQLKNTDANLTQWQTHFPKHSANGDFLATYLLNRQKTPTTIAVFLPESGEYVLAAKAVKAGFMAAYKQTKQTGTVPTVHFYDSAITDPLTLYHKAVNEGAGLIIGPLNKEQVEQLAKVNTLDIPVLTLNHIPGLNKANLYQFALSPIDEAEQITHQAVKDGHKKALVLIPKTELGDRMQSYFKIALQKNGGTLLKAKQYSPDNTNYTAILKELLNITESEKRYTQLKRFMPTLQFTPRKRQDVDALFITAYPQNAKAIQAQLQALSKTHNIPIYATPQIYTGIDSTTTNDLNAITFCDVPWVFKAAYPGNLSQEALATTWKPFPEVYMRLVAMGIDAYNLVPHLSQLGKTPYQGATGKLRLTDENRIQRQLVCAKFNHALPQLLQGD